MDKILVKKFLLYGEKGNLLRVANINLEGQSVVPLLELDLSDTGGIATARKKVSASIEEESMFLLESFTAPYKSRGKFGHYGDLLQVTGLQAGTEIFYTCDFIGQIAFPKPGLAVDLVLFLEDCDRRLFFVGITRKKNPGKGLSALPGGFRNVVGRHFETAAEAIIRESREEIELELEAIHPEKVKSEPEINVVPVRVKFGEEEPSVLMQRIGTFQTSDIEVLSGLNSKRVYETTAYGLRIWLHNHCLTKEKIAEWLTAGDDAAGLIMVEVGKDDMPDFVFGHHQEIFQKALKILGITKTLEMREKQKGV